MKESHLRSLIKGISWRITGTIDTIVIAYVITGHFFSAIKIGIVEVFTKIILFYFHERIWGIISWGRNPGAGSRIRSLVKGISWRGVGTLDTIVLSYVITNRIDFALQIGSIELITKVCLYYLHERAWNRIKWGVTYKVVS